MKRVFLFLTIFVSVTRCDFDLQSAPGSSLSTVGLSLDNCTGYLVEENFFHRSSMPGTPSLYALAEAEFQLGADNTAVPKHRVSSRQAAVSSCRPTPRRECSAWRVTETSHRWSSTIPSADCCSPGSATDLSAFWTSPASTTAHTC